MMLGARKSLGLAVTERGITAVEVALAGARRTLTHAAELHFTETVSPARPEELSKALRQMLKHNGFTASRCVIGLPTGWITCREELLPPMDPESLRSALAIAAERGFASGVGELACDYAVTPLPKGFAAMLVATCRRTLDPLVEAARLTGLSVAAVTASDGALAGAIRRPVPLAGRLILVLQPQSAELLYQTPQGLRLIRHLTTCLESPPASPDALGDELRRIGMMLPADTAAGTVRDVLIWNAADLPRASLEALAQRANLTPVLCDLADIEVTSAAPLTGPRVAQAAALACGAGEAAMVDFLHSRLVPPKTRRMGRTTLWATVAALTVLATGLYFFLEWRSCQNESDRLQARLAGLRDSSQQANDLVENASFARGWYDRRPALLDCLKDITTAFPDRGDIWATNVSIHEDLQVQLTGKAVTQRAVQDVLDQFKTNPRLAVKQWSLSQGTGSNGSPEVSFTISLTPRGANAK